MVLSFYGVYELFLNENMGIIISLSSFALVLLLNAVAGFGTLYILPSMGIAGTVLLWFLVSDTAHSGSHEA